MSSDQGTAPTPNQDVEPVPDAPPPTEVTAVPADDSQALSAKIERTRAQLGHTVEAMAAKVDVKNQARRKAADLRERLPSTTQAKEQLTAKAGSARKRAASTATAAKDRAWNATPPKVQRAAKQVADRVPEVARDRRVQGALAAVGASVLAFWAILRRRR